MKTKGPAIRYVRHTAAVTGLLLLVTLLVMLWRTFQFVPDYASGEAIDVPGLDAESAVGRLSGAVKIPTIAHMDRSQTDTTAFRTVHEYLEAEYPLFHEVADRQFIGHLSLLYTWHGRNTALRPLLISGHLDVARISPDAWSDQPFSGRVENGTVSGRGSVDNKAGVIAIMEALEALARSGHQPTRTVYVAFGHDEELGGGHGAALITDEIISRGQQLHAVIDEGGIIVSSVLDDVDERVAIVGIAEKGSLNVRITAHGSAGHSAAPTNETSIEILGSALSRLSTMNGKRYITEPVKIFLSEIGPLLPFAQRFVLSNRWLFKSMIVSKMAREPHLRAMIESTYAPTMIAGGLTPNVIPLEAQATINVRMLPGDDPGSVVARIKRLFDDERISISVLGQVTEPSPVASITSRTFANIRSVAAGLIAPDSLVVAPYLFVAGTDSKHYSKLTNNIYRFSGLTLTRDELLRIHGPDENISIGGFLSAIRFYYNIISIESNFDDS